MLHKRIRDQNKVAGKPAPQRNPHRGQEVIPRTESLLAPDKHADERTFQEESEHAFHCQRLSDHAAGIAGKVRPVRSELKLHGNSGDDSHGKIESENLGPKPNGLVVLFIIRLQGTPFPIHQKPRQSHSELRKEVVIGQREGELQAAPKRRIDEIRVHFAPSDRVSAIIRSRTPTSNGKYCWCKVLTGFGWWVA